MDTNIFPTRKDYIPLSNGFLRLVTKYNFKIHMGTAFGVVSGQYVSIGSFARGTSIVFTIFNKDAENLIHSTIRDKDIKNTVLEFNRLEINFSGKYYREERLLQKIDETIVFWTEILNKIQPLKENSKSNFVLMNNISFPLEEKALSQYKADLVEYLKIKPENLKGLINGFLKSIPSNVFFSFLCGVIFHLVHIIIFPFNYFISLFSFVDMFKKNTKRIARDSWPYILVGLLLSTAISMLISVGVAYYLKYKMLNLNEFFRKFLTQFEDGYAIRNNLMFVVLLFFASILQRRIPDDVQAYEGWQLSSEEILIFEKKIYRAKLAGVLIVIAIVVGALILIFSK